MRCPIGMTVLNRRRLPGLFARTAGLACVAGSRVQRRWHHLRATTAGRIPRQRGHGKDSQTHRFGEHLARECGAGIRRGNQRRQLTALCQLVEPAAQGVCQQALAGFPPTGSSSFSDFAFGYVATRGDKALVGLTATHCSPQEKPTCSTNKDRAAIFSSDRTFDALYADATRALSPGNTDNRYSLVPCVRVGSAWYLYLPPADF